jgi:hypothetical protein
MTPMTIGWIVFACIFGGALIGMVLRSRLPEHHLDSESRDLVKVGMGLIATMSALVLGLLVASAKSSFDTQRSELAQMAANVILLDRVLAHYGPETKECRELVRNFILITQTRYWPDEAPLPPNQPPFSTEVLYDKIQDLAPKNEAQRNLQIQAIKTCVDIAQTRWLLFAQRDSSIPTPFLIMLVFWLTVLFASFSLFAPPHATTIATLLVCALSVSGAIYLILELDRPFDGLVRVSSLPLRNALEQLGQ